MNKKQDTRSRLLNGNIFRTISNCSVKGSITGAVTPGAVAGRAVHSIIESCETDITLNGEALTVQVGETSVPYESEDQEEETAEDNAA